MLFGRKHRAAVAVRERDLDGPHRDAHAPHRATAGAHRSLAGPRSRPSAVTSSILGRGNEAETPGDVDRGPLPRQCRRGVSSQIRTSSIRPPCLRGHMPHHPKLHIPFLPSPPFMVHGEPLAHPPPPPSRLSPARFCETVLHPHLTATSPCHLAQGSWQDIRPGGQCTSAPVRSMATARGATAPRPFNGAGSTSRAFAASGDASPASPPPRCATTRRGQRACPLTPRRARWHSRSSG